MAGKPKGWSRKNEKLRIECAMLERNRNDNAKKGAAFISTFVVLFALCLALVEYDVILENQMSISYGALTAAGLVLFYFAFRSIYEAYDCHKQLRKVEQDYIKHSMI